MQVEDMLEMVSRFNREVVGLPVLCRPTPIGWERRTDCAKHLEEEIAEFVDAHSVEEQADAMVDLVYVALGRLFEMGVLPGPAFEEVHKANMKRVRLKDGVDFKKKVGKPEGWVGPDLAKLCDITLEEVEWLIARKNMGGVLTPSQFHEAAPPDDADFYDPVMHPERCKHHAHDRASRERDVLDGSTPMSERLVPRQVKRPKLLVIGHGRHGKDTVCEMLRDLYGLSFTSSSMFCAEHVMLPAFRALEAQGGPVYKNAGECYAHRHSVEHLAAPGYYNAGGNRAFWYDTIRDFNRPDASALVRAVLEKHDIYCGVRSTAEFHAARNAGLFDFAIWVDRSEHVAPESATSMALEPWMADYVLDNNGSLEDLRLSLVSLYEGRIKELCVG